MSKRVTLLLIAILIASSLLMFKTASASADTTRSVPEFTLEYVDYSYYVPPTTTSTTDPYTNETTTTTVSGYYVENKTVQATIKNNIGASYYNFRYKGHYSEEWSYYPFDPDSRFGYSLPDAFYVPYKASDSSYTVAALPSYFFKDIPEGGQVDVQVQALFGDFDADPWGHLLPIEPTYDFDFTGTTSDWSKTQTVAIGGNQTPMPSSTPEPTPTPTVTPSPSPIPVPGQSFFFVESNSTVSALFFNSTSAALSFTVSGEQYTTGYVKVTIAKSLLSSVQDVKVYLDGSQLEVAVTEEGDLWLLSFTYMHSTHQVTMNFASVSSDESQLGPALVIGLPIAVVVLLFVVTRIKDGKSKMHSEKIRVV